jgi:PTH1 family peptidyl-tRNA hydrolase
MDASPIRMIVGLGNPGDKYTKTRHNAGFLFLDELQKAYPFDLKAEKQCFGLTAKTVIAGHTVRILKPDTFMNLSGKSVQATLAYYKIALENVLVVHDELDLDAGIVRLKLSGGHGGNNGLRDIIAKMSNKDFARLRIGIGHPGVGKDVSGYVLSRPNKADQTAMNNAIAESLRVIEQLVVGDFPSAMNQLHTAVK